MFDLVEMARGLWLVVNWFFNFVLNTGFRAFMDCRHQIPLLNCGVVVAVLPINF